MALPQPLLDHYFYANSGHTTANVVSVEGQSPDTTNNGPIRTVLTGYRTDKRQKLDPLCGSEISSHILGSPWIAIYPEYGDDDAHCDAYLAGGLRGATLKRAPAIEEMVQAPMKPDCLYSQGE